MCVRRVGDVTNAIHTLQPGDSVGVRGPYGEPFPVAEMKGKDVLFACGGLGVAPLRSLINEVLDNREDFGRVIILYGARDPSQILFRDDVAEWEARDDIEFHMTVDRGDDSWDGHVGVITTLFPDISINPQATIAAVCGPPIMYRFVMIELLGKGIPDAQIYLSLERRMKCGVGKCGHCQIDGLYCCQDGPVFRYADIKGLEAAL
jgi:NAD(P)H-flavin reductase